MIDLKMIGLSLNYPDRSADDTYKNRNGFGDWVFMHFTTAFRVKTPKGVIDGTPGEILINSPNYPQWHQGIDKCFKNNWFIFNDESIEGLINELNIPINIPIKLTQDVKLLTQFFELQKESILKDSYWREKIDLLIRGILLEIARGVNNKSDNFLSERQKELLPVFQDIRMTVQQSYDKKWTIDEMSTLVPLSSSRFSVLYKKFFLVSPLNDLLITRLSHAKALLLNSTLNIEVIAEHCGFSSIHYFWRIFKRHNSISPSEYRKTLPL
ncbi:MAG: AraC family transcriptional regulator [Spirochaetaceae bacterium]